jgi:RNA polymerase sigma-70 factor, ECF subfamily
MASQDLAEVLRVERGAVLATLIRFTGDMGLAEDAVQDAVVTALEQWPRTGMPANPAAWLTTAARRKALDRIRRESTRGDRELQSSLLTDPEAPLVGPGTNSDRGAVRDDQLRLLFTICHPALAPDGRIALALRTLGGLTTPEIARAFLVTDTTMGQRISRAKSKISSARIPYRIPEDHELPGRLQSVLTVVYSIFTAGHQAADEGVFDARVDLCEEAIRLAELLVQLMPDEPECQGLLALLLATHARRGARVAADGSQVLLEQQDRSRWDRAMIERADFLLEVALARPAPGPFCLQAAISCVHSNALTFDDTDWLDIAHLYEMLETRSPSAVVRLNRAVAVAFAFSPDAGIALLDTIPESEVAHWFRFWSTKAELLVRAGDTQGALAAWEHSLTLEMNASDRRSISQRIEKFGKE